MCRNSIVVKGSGAQHFDINNDVSIGLDFFKNGEVNMEFKDSVRGKELIILQSFPDVNNELMELIVMIDAAKRSGARWVTAVLPLYPYARQDRRHAPGTPISARVVCDLLGAVRLNRLVTFDLHATQIQGFASNKMKFDHIELTAFLAFHLKKQIKDLQDWVFCSPDAGGVTRTRKLANLCESQDLCLMHKNRGGPNEVKSMKIIGEVTDRKVMIVDDMIDTGGTLVKAMDLLKENGARRVCAIGTHGIFSPPAFDLMNNHGIYVTDSQPIKEDGRPAGLVVFPLKNFLLDVFNRIGSEVPLGALFTRWNE